MCSPLEYFFQLGPFFFTGVRSKYFALGNPVIMVTENEIESASSKSQQCLAESK